MAYTLYIIIMGSTVDTIMAYTFAIVGYTWLYSVHYYGLYICNYYCNIL